MFVKKVWVFSYVISFVLIIAIIIAFNILNGFTPKYKVVKTQSQALSQIKKSSKPRYILRVGLYIESLEIKSANTVTMSGYVWQTLPNDFSKSDAGITFPDAENVKINLAYDKTYKGKCVLGWYFEGDFIQEFNYSQYPFDYKVVWIRLWNKMLDRSIGLIPDFDSYSLTNKGGIQGVEKNIVMRNYRLLDSYFDYTHNYFDTSFGFDSSYKSNSTAELRFNMLLKRKTINAFIIHILPLVIVLLIAHLMIINEPLTESENDKRRSNFFSMLRIITFILFIVIVAHIELRGRLPGSEIVLLDHFYFIAYFIVIYCVLFSILCLSENSDNQVLRFMKNYDLLYPKAIFMPLILFMVFIVFINYITN